MSTAAALANLLRIKSDINHYTQEQIYYSTKQESVAAKLSKQVKAEEKWENAFDDIMYGENDKKVGGRTYHAGRKPDAEAYAEMKSKHYDEELKLELEALDIEYDSMKESLEGILTELRADEEGAKQLVQTEAQDTNLLSS